MINDILKLVGILTIGYIVYYYLKEKKLPALPALTTLEGPEEKKHVINKESWQVQRDRDGRLQGVTVYRDVIY